MTEEPSDHEKLPSHVEHAVPPPIPPGKLRRLGFVAAGIALAIAAAGIADREVKAREVARWTAQQAIPSVSIVMPQHGQTGSQLVLPGNIEAWYAAPIYARVNGYLKKWYFDYGAHVKQGQVLATIDTPDLDAQFAAAKADLNAARAQVKVYKAQMDFAQETYIRWRDSPKGSVSEQETESKKADYQSAMARYDAGIADVQSDQGVVDRLQALEGFKNIVAPFDGVVTDRTTDVGDLINAGSGSGGGSAPQLFTIADVHEMRVYVQVPQAMSSQIESGMSAELDLPQYPGRTFQAIVATTAGAIDPSARTLLVELHASNPHGVLQPGTYAEVHFELPSNPNVLTIPATALLFRQAGLQVAVVGPHGQAELKSITLGRNFGDDVEVLTGLSASDEVIDSPPDSLVDGEVVQVVNPAAAGSADLANAAAAKTGSPPAEDPPPAPARQEGATGHTAH
ncbi:MAG TPA: efflux RND transporter periplasmic adaptor subunit [Steroidobacteraceae bacterium]|nr:efflux RND transporter periplasmic adaptor subunit [Steroidobacteraceae bacterium]